MERIIKPFSSTLLRKYSNLGSLHKRCCSTKTEPQQTIPEKKKKSALGFWIPVGGIVALGVSGMLIEVLKPNPQKEMLSRKEAGQQEVYIKPNLKQRLQEIPLGKRILYFTGAVVVFAGFNFLTVPFALPFMKRYGGIPYLPSMPNQLEAAFEMIPVEQLKGKKFVDLGSGDGRVVIEAAKRGFKATGYEINPWLVWYARRKAKKEGVDVTFVKGNFWDVNLSEYSVVNLFGVDKSMSNAQKKFDAELQPGTYVLTTVFKLPNWKPLDMQEQVWAYKK